MSKLCVPVLLVSGLLVSQTHAQMVIFGVGYEPQRFDTYVRANAGACCIGEYRTLTFAYIGQSFTATGKHPSSITINVANNLPQDVPRVRFHYRLLLAELDGPSFKPGQVLWETDRQSLPAEPLSYADYTFRIRGVKFEVGKQYAWILDSATDRDGLEDALAFAWNDGVGTQGVPSYDQGKAWFQGAFGQGRPSDFAYPWTYGNGGSMGFLIRYRND